MLVDAKSFSEGQTLDADVCIIGAGPVGLTLAAELGAPGARICVLERGPAPGEAPEDALDGEVTGGTYPPLETMRDQGVGGTAVLWSSEIARARRGARFGRLQPVDFEQRSDVPFSGWPFARAELDPHYDRAAEICGIAPLSDTPPEWQLTPGTAPLQLGDEIVTRIVRYGPESIFTRDLPESAQRSDDVTLVVNARALRIEAEPGAGRARRVIAASAPGRTFAVEARLFVLALGGIENARLLLLSNDDPQSGLGSKHDVIGRYFMDHPTASCRLVPAGPGAVERLALYDTIVRQGRVGQGVLGLADETIRREGLLNSGSILVPIAERWSRALDSTATLAGAARRRTMPDGALAHARNAALGMDVVAAAAYRRLVERMPALERTTRYWPTTRLLDTLDTGHISGWSRLPFAGRRFPLFGLFQVVEQAPEPARRITLSPRKDRFGQPLPRLHWFITEREQESMRRTQELLAAALARAGIGRLMTTAELAGEDDLLDHVGPSAHHHLGTTRMHPDPKQGVVDEDGLVHGMSNLYACGTSVFPGGGYINPTFTVVALTVRLAGHLRSALQAGVDG